MFEGHQLVFDSPESLEPLFVFGLVCCCQVLGRLGSSVRLWSRKREDEGLAANVDFANLLYAHFFSKFYYLDWLIVLLVLVHEEFHAL